MLRQLAAGLLLPGALALPLSAPAAPALTPAQASEAQAQHMRGDANAKARDDADQASLRQAATGMEATAAYLDSPEVRQQALGFFPLYIRNLDVKRDLARIYARLGRKEQALATLESTLNYAWVPGTARMLESDPGFASLRGEPRFQALNRTAELPSRLWQGPAADLPYRERLTVEERIAGLSLFWAEARSYFVHFDHVPELDWNKVYLDYLPKVMAAETTADYYRVLMQLAPLLQDGHTNIYPPKELASRFYARPPLDTMLVNGKVLVERVASKRLAQRLHAGEEIVSIDGVPVQRYAEERVAPFASSSTPQDRLVRMYGYQLLMGEADAPLKLGLRDAAGREHEETVARAGYDDLAPKPLFAFRMLPGGVAYFALDHLESDAGPKAFQAVLPQIMKAKALVIDVRSNGGGSTNFGDQILAWLTKAPIPHAMSLRRANDAGFRDGGASPIVWEPPFAFPSHDVAHAEVFTGKVAVLTGPRTFSAGEDFVLAFNALHRGITVGESTGGSTGQPMMFRLPGGGTARICAKRDLLPDGTPFVGRGLRPDIEARPTVQSVRSGADPVLERALQALGGAGLAGR
jgi:C-terminal processing protease CtpA/Prc